MASPTANMATSEHGNVLDTTCGAYNPGLTGTVSPRFPVFGRQGGRLGRGLRPNDGAAHRLFHRLGRGSSACGAGCRDGERAPGGGEQQRAGPLDRAGDRVAHGGHQRARDRLGRCQPPRLLSARDHVPMGAVDTDGENTFTDAVCVYGDDSVHIQSTTASKGRPRGATHEVQDPGVQVMTSPPPDFDEQSGPNPGFDGDAKREGEMDPLLAQPDGGFHRLRWQDGFSDGGTWNEQASSSAMSPISNLDTPLDHIEQRARGWSEDHTANTRYLSMGVTVKGIGRYLADPGTYPALEHRRHQCRPAKSNWNRTSSLNHTILMAGTCATSCVGSDRFELRTRP